MAASEPIQFQNSTNFFSLFCAFVGIAAIGVAIVSAGFRHSGEISFPANPAYNLGSFNARQLSNRLITDDIVREIDASLRMENAFKGQKSATSRIRYVKLFKHSHNIDESLDVQHESTFMDNFALNLTDTGKIRITVMPRQPKPKEYKDSSNEVTMALASENIAPLYDFLPK